jgi:phosphate transport system substrate-binding protein
MKFALFGGAAAGALLASQVAFAAPEVKIDGSSTVYPVTEAVAEEFQKAKKGAVRVTVGISGTGGGFKKFCRGETDISNASRPILAQEMEACKKVGIDYIELPVAFDALTVAVSPKNNLISEITVDELKKIWEPAAQGKITNWKQIRPEFPDMKLNLYGAGSDSGTFDYFTEAVVGKAKASRGDYTASEDDNVLVQGISGDPQALGYVPFAYVHENPGKLKPLKVVDPQTGKAVAPSMETVIDGTYQPLSRPIFIYVNRKSADRSEVKEFVEFYLTKGAELAQEVGYTPLPAEAYKVAMDRFAARKTGTAFGGHPEVGMKIMDLLARELKS